MKQVPKTNFQLCGIDMLNLLNLLGKSRSLNTQLGSHFCKKARLPLGMEPGEFWLSALTAVYRSVINNFTLTRRSKLGNFFKKVRYPTFFF